MQVYFKTCAAKAGPKMPLLHWIRNIGREYLESEHLCFSGRLVSIAPGYLQV